MNADVAFGDDNHAAPSSGILDAIRFCPVDSRYRQYLHAQARWKFSQAFQDEITIKQSVLQTPVCVDHEVFAKVLVLARILSICRLVKSVAMVVHVFTLQWICPNARCSFGTKSRFFSMRHFNHVYRPA